MTAVTNPTCFRSVPLSLSCAWPGSIIASLPALNIQYCAGCESLEKHQALNRAKWVTGDWRRTPRVRAHDQIKRASSEFSLWLFATPFRCQTMRIRGIVLRRINWLETVTNKTETFQNARRQAHPTDHIKDHVSLDQERIQIDQAVMQRDVACNLVYMTDFSVCRPLFLYEHRHAVRVEAGQAHG